MKLLFLRGQVPSDRPKEQIMFDDLLLNDDMWTQLAFQLVVAEDDGYGEVWYEKGNRETRYVRGKFTERWVPRYRTAKCSFEPDVVFARGGFKFMTNEMWKYPKAFKIYYGAGERVIPKPRQPWDLVLVDTPRQLEKVEALGYTAALFIKPAADNIFIPQPSGQQFDVIFVANHNTSTNKGHEYLLPAMREYNVLQVGIHREGWPKKNPNTEFMGWVPRNALPCLYGQAKLAVIRAPGKDSCPRVIPEALASDCPILVSEGTAYWEDMYMNERTGMTFNKSNFHEQLETMLGNIDQFSPRSYYDEHLSLGKAAYWLYCLIQENKGR